MPNGVFLLKADIDAPDEQLRLLRKPGAVDGPPGLDALTEAVEIAVGARVRDERSQVLCGTFHWILSARLVDGRSVAIRVNRVQHPALRAGLSLEARMSELLRSRGISAPEVLGTHTASGDCPWDFIVSEWIEGVSLASLDADEAATLRVLHSLGALLRRIHEIRLQGAGAIAAQHGGDVVGSFEKWHEFVSNHANEHIATCQSLGALNAQDAEFARKLFESPDEREARMTRSLLHGDPSPANVLLGPNGSVRLVDWEDALVGDPIFELASAAAFHPERRWPALFDGYGSGAMDRNEVRQLFWRYMLRVALARTVTRHRFGIMDSKGRPPAAGRVARAIEALRIGRSA